MGPSWQPHLVSGALAILIGLVVTGNGRVAAQEATPEAAPETKPTSHSASIHQGTCDALDPAPVHLLENIPVPAVGVATPGAMGRMSERHEVETSTTIVRVRLDDLLSAPSAISVQEGAEPNDTVIACGEIAGVVQPHPRGLSPGGLMIPLRELNGSGFAGMAWLQPCIDDTTTVTLFLAQELVESGPMAGRPVTTPAL